MDGLSKTLLVYTYIRSLQAETQLHSDLDTIVQSTIWILNL